MASNATDSGSVGASNNLTTTEKFFAQEGSNLWQKQTQLQSVMFTPPPPNEGVIWSFLQGN